MEWTNQQIAQWQSIKQAYVVDTSAMDAYKQKKQLQLQAQQEMLKVLNTFLDDAITLREFNTTFQRKTHTEWSLFGLRGMSGGLFFNKLVKYIPQEEIFTHLLRVMLRLPIDQQSGRQQMTTFTRFLKDLVASQLAERSQLQPARIPFFLSIWWHIQETELWPIFSLDLRSAILPEEAGNFLQCPIETYFLFKTRFLTLKHALDLDTWGLEHLILWHHSNTLSGKNCTYSLASSHSTFPSSLLSADRKEDYSRGAVHIYTSTISKKGSMVYKKGHRSTNHTYIQWLLAKIGLKIGCKVWIAINDHEKVWNEEKLGSLSLQSLPMVADAAFQQIIQHIDILWLCKNEVIAAYEIELTTADISKSLLRLSDLAVLLPKRDLQLCMVTPQRCFDTVQTELSRPIFQDHDICKRSKVIIQEHLVQNAEHILRWANGPSVVHDLALYLGVKE